MNNNQAIAEIEDLKSYYYQLIEEYTDYRKKEFKSTIDGIQIKINALDLAIIALNHIEGITTEDER